VPDALPFVGDSLDRKAHYFAASAWVPPNHHIEPWMSVEDIRSGTRWREVVAHALDSTNFGIICITPDNQDSRWLNFEAGPWPSIPTWRASSRSASIFTPVT
jgi:hypothetical protein